MLFTSKTIKSALSVSIICGLSTGTFAVQASECGVLKLQKNRSPGTAIVNNSCNESALLAEETLLQLPAESRLWLESIESSSSTENTQIICQNKSSQSVDIKVNSALSPWISPEGLAQCSQWSNGRLECHASNSDKNNLFCASASIKKPPTLSKPEQKTSLSMRGLKSSIAKATTPAEQQQILNQWINYLKPEIDLCRKIYQISQPITLSWKIKASGEITETSVKETLTDKQFADCAIEVIQNFEFPTFNKDTQVTFSF